MPVWNHGGLYLGQKQTSESEQLPWKSLFSIMLICITLEKNMQTDVHPFVSIGEFFVSSMSCFVFVPCAFLGGHLVCGVLSRNVVQWVPDKHPLWYCCM